MSGRPPRGEESPGSTGRDTGEIPVPATERTCHRNETAPDGFQQTCFMELTVVFIGGKGEKVG